MKDPLVFGAATWTAFTVAVFLGNMGTYARFFPGVGVLAIALYILIAIFGLLCFAAVKGRRGQLMRRGDAIAAITPAIALAAVLSVGLLIGVWTGV